MIRHNARAMRGVAFLTASVLALLTPAARATEGIDFLDLTESWNGIAAIMIFVLAYALVIGEKTLHLHLRKSKPVMVAAGIGVHMLVNTGRF